MITTMTLASNQYIVILLIRGYRTLHYLNWYGQSSWWCLCNHFSIKFLIIEHGLATIIHTILPVSLMMFFKPWSIIMMNNFFWFCFILKCCPTLYWPKWMYSFLLLATIVFLILFLMISPFLKLFLIMICQEK